jgi:tetratricopeptide (TPR) repeat protein
MSPKNKGKFGKAKPTVEAQDEFVSGVQKAAEYIRPYARRLAAVIVGVIAVSLVVIGYRRHVAGKEEAATTLLARAITIYEQPVLGEDELAIFAAVDPEKRPVSHPTVKDRAQAALAPLDELHAEYGGTEVAARARLFHASVLYDAERYDEATALYQAFAKSDAPADLRLVAREGAGVAIEAAALAKEDAEARKAGLGEALAVYQALQPEVDGPGRDDALYHQARVLQSLDRKAEAIALYKEILDTLPGTALRSEISNRLAILEDEAPPVPAPQPQPSDGGG